MPDRAPFAIFLHMEHAGGTTFKGILSRMYPRGAVYEARRGARFAEFIALTPERRAAYHALIGHTFYGVHALIPRPAVYYTWLRDPVERILSTYHFFGRKATSRRHQAYRDGTLTLEALIERPWYSHTQLSRVIGVPTEQLTAFEVENLSPNALDIAKAHLETFGVVGLTEYYDETILLIAKALGWQRPPYYVVANTRGHKNRREDLTPAVRQRIEQLAAPEIELYTWARERFIDQLRQLGPDFAREIEAFREGNARFNARQRRITRLTAPLRGVYRRLRRLMGRSE